MLYAPDSYFLWSLCRISGNMGSQHLLFSGFFAPTNPLGIPAGRFSAGHPVLLYAQAHERDTGSEGCADLSMGALGDACCFGRGRDL